MFAKDIEEYFKREGLLGFVARERVGNVIENSPLSFFLTWLIGLWAIPNIILYLSSGKWSFGIMFFLLITVVGVFVFDVIISGLFGYAIFEKLLIGFVFVHPIVLGIYNWQVSMNPSVGVATTVIGFLWQVIMILELTKNIFSMLLPGILVFVRITFKSFSLLTTVFPILLVVVLFSIFSQDFWFILNKLQWLNLIKLLTLLIVPSIFLSYSKLQNEARKLLGEFSNTSAILKTFEKTDFIAEKFKNKYVCSLEWEKIKQAFLWRDTKTIFAQHSPKVIKIATFRLCWLIEIINLLLIVVFFLYFMFLLNLLLSPATIAIWTETTIVYSVDLLGYKLPYLLPSTMFITAKISILLSVIVSVTSRVFMATDEEYKSQVFGWLRTKSRAWFSADVIYEASLFPDYQVLDSTSLGKNVIDLQVLIPARLEKGEARKICTKCAKDNAKTDYKIMLSAFESLEQSGQYDFRFEKIRWQLDIDLSGKEHFLDLDQDYLPAIDLQHYLGVKSIQKNEEIFEAWFGNSPKAMELGKMVWDDDDKHNLILHPYVEENTGVFNMKVRLAQRFESSAKYKRIMKRIFSIAKHFLPDTPIIGVILYFSRTEYILANLEYSIQKGLVGYSDEYMKNQAISISSDWIEPIRKDKAATVIYQIRGKEAQ